MHSAFLAFASEELDAQAFQPHLRCAQPPSATAATTAARALAWDDAALLGFADTLPAAAHAADEDQELARLLELSEDELLMHINTSLLGAELQQLQQQHVHLPAGLPPAYAGHPHHASSCTPQPSAALSSDTALSQLQLPRPAAAAVVGDGGKRKRKKPPRTATPKKAPGGVGGSPGGRSRSATGRRWGATQLHPQQAEVRPCVSGGSTDAHCCTAPSGV